MARLGKEAGLSVPDGCEGGLAARPGSDGGRAEAARGGGPAGVAKSPAGMLGFVPGVLAPPLMARLAASWDIGSVTLAGLAGSTTGRDGGLATAGVEGGRAATAGVDGGLAATAGVEGGRGAGSTGGSDASLRNDWRVGSGRAPAGSDPDVTVRLFGAVRTCFLSSSTTSAIDG